MIGQGFHVFQCYDADAANNGAVDKRFNRRREADAAGSLATTPGDYARLLAESEQTAAALLAEYEPGDQVAVWGINKVEYVLLQMGAALANIVLVTLNHRLGALGYLHLGDLDPSFAASGNAGMLDIVLALEWVRDNIESFGGDPRSVTIFGESGGGRKVTTLLGMPAARGLFHRAIIQSGPGIRMEPRDRAHESALQGGQIVHLPKFTLAATATI